MIFFFHHCIYIFLFSSESPIKHYKHYSVARAYQGDTFFWGLVPQAGDAITISFEVFSLYIWGFPLNWFWIFQPPVPLASYRFVSGNAEHPSDRFFNTTCEILPEDTQKAASITKQPPLKDGFLIVGGFDHFGIAEGTLGPEIGPIKKFRLSIHASSENWAILSELFLKKVSW